MNNTIEEATPIILPQDSLNLCLAHFEMDNFDVDGHIIEINDLVDTSYPKTISLWIEKYESSPSPPIALLLESPSTLELKPLLDAPTDTLLVILNQKISLVGILKVHKKVIGWDIFKMINNNIKIFVTDLSVVGTTFEDYLQNLSMMLK